MMLSFWAKGDELVPQPGYTPNAGSFPQYIGRELRLENGVAGYPATVEPFVCDSDSTAGRRLLLLARRDRCLLPADADTAIACGVQFREYEPIDGVMVPVSVS